MVMLQKIYCNCPIWLQSLFCTGYGCKEKYYRYGKVFDECLEWLNESQWWPLERLTEYQNEQVQIIIRTAYENVPFYRDRFDKVRLHPDDIRSIEDLDKLPILTKEEVIEAGSYIHNQKIPRWKLVHGHTSGTTGSALQLVYTRECVQFQWAVWWRHRGRFGMTWRDREANFGGKLLVPYEQTKPPFWRENRIFNQSVFSQHHMKPEFLKYYVERLNQEPYDYYSGYPSTIYLLASYLEQSGQELKYRPKIVFTGAETLLEYQKKLIARHIAKATDEYGTGEYAGNASKCEYDYYHIDMEFGVLEILPLEGAQHNDDEIIGKIVVTGFANPAMPFIRYEMGDIATYLPNFKCPCGRESPVLKCIDGRIESYIHTADGRRIGRLDHIFKDMNWVRESQIIQNEAGKIIIRLIPRNKYGESDINFLLNECYSRLGSDMKIDLEVVDNIPRTKSGKFRAVISKIDYNKKD